MQTILQRSENELTRRVYNAMVRDPLPNDWSEMVREDFTKIGMVIDEEYIASLSEGSYKN